MKRGLFFIAGVSFLMGGVSVALASGDPVVGKTKATSCVGCHGAKGEGVNSNPPLAGLNEAYIVKQSQDLKSGVRKSAIKKMIMQPLSDQDIEDLAAYFASLK